MQLYEGNLWGLIPFSIGCLIAIQFKGPASTKESGSGKIGLVTVFGKRTETIVTGLTLVLDWPINIISFIEVDMSWVDMDFPNTIIGAIRCNEKEDDTMNKSAIEDEIAYVYGSVSLSCAPNDRAEGAIGSPDYRSAGKNIQTFLDIGGMTGAKKQLDDLLISGVKELGKIHTTKWMETESRACAEYLQKQILQSGSNLTNTKGLGLKFLKFEVLLKPSDKVIDKRNDILIEKAEKSAQILDTNTWNQRAKKRMFIHRKSGNNTITMEEVMRELKDQTLLQEGKVQIIDTKGGAVLADIRGNNSKGGTV